MNRIPYIDSRRGAGIGRLPVTVAVLTAIYILFFFIRGQVPAGFLLLFDFAYLVFLPGLLMSRLLQGRIAPVTEAVFSLVLGTALFYVLLLVFSVTGWPTRLAGIIIPALTVAMTAAGTVRDRRRSGAPIEADHAPVRPDGWVIGLLILMIFCVAIILSVGDPLLYTGDSQDHIAYIKAAARSGSVIPEDFLYRDGGSLTRDIRKGFGHSMWGALSALRGNTDIVSVWKYISLVGSLSILAALFSAGILMFGSPAAGLTAALLFVLFYHGGLKGYQLITIAYGFPFGKIFYIPFLSLLMLSAGRKGRTVMFLLALSAFTAVATHIGHLILIIFIISVAGLRTLTLPGEKDRIPKFMGSAVIPAFWAAIACAPYLLIRFLGDYSPNNVIHQEITGLLHFGRSMTIVSPLVFFGSAGVLFAVAAIAAVFLRLDRKNDAFGLLRWGTIGVLILTFNPFTVVPVMDRIAYLLFRLEFAVPSMLTVAFLIVTLTRRAAGITDRPGRWAALILTAVSALLLLPHLLSTPSGSAYGGKALANARSRSCLEISDLIAEIERATPPGSIVASDPVTSYSIPAFTDRYVVCTYDQHSVPNDSTALQRILDCRDIFSPAVSINEAMTLLSKWNTEYIAVNGRLPASLHTMYWKTGAEAATAAATRFEAAGPAFEKIYEHDRVWLFRFNGKNAMTPDTIYEERASTTFPAGRSFSPEEALHLARSGTGSVSIGLAEISEANIKRGDTFGLRLEWVRTGEIEPGSYKVYVRFDTSFKRGPFYSSAYGKIYRKALEKMRGERYRFRHDHVPVGGIYPPDRWPLFEAIADSITIRVPGDVAPGEYTVSIRFSRSLRYPNYTLEDLLTDEDMFSGEPVGRITIR